MISIIIITTLSLIKKIKVESFFKKAKKKSQENTFLLFLVEEDLKFDLSMFVKVTPMKLKKRLNIMLRINLLTFHSFTK